MADEVNNVFRVRCERCRKEMLPKYLRYVISEDLLICIRTEDCHPVTRGALPRRTVRHLPRAVPT